MLPCQVFLTGRGEFLTQHPHRNEQTSGRTSSRRGWPSLALHDPPRICQGLELVPPKLQIRYVAEDVIGRFTLEDYQVCAISETQRELPQHACQPHRELKLGCASWNGSRRKRRDPSSPATKAASAGAIDGQRPRAALPESNKAASWRSFMKRRRLGGPQVD